MKLKRSSPVLNAVASLLFLNAAWLAALSLNDAYGAECDFSLYTTIDSSGRHLIHLPAGTYTISRTIVLSSNTTLEGEGEATVLRNSRDFRGPQFITNRDHQYGNANITLRSFRAEIVTASIPLTAEPGILRFESVENLNIDALVLSVDSPMYAVDLSSHIRNAAVERCNITNKGSGGGLMIRNSDSRLGHLTSDVSVRNNRIESFQDEPIAAFGWEGAMEDVSIENNTVEAHNASFGICTYGIDSKKNRGTIRTVRMAANRIRGSRIGGIAAKGGARSIEVTANTIEDSRGDGIFLHSGGEGLPGVQEITIRQNTILRAGRHCIFAAGNKIRIDGNVINGCSQSGIYAAGDVSVTNNDITNAAPGIMMDGVRRENVVGNTLHTGAGIITLNKDGSVSKSEDSR
ncbi:MAG TPA: right-handed parallel beta-helix repeat-containing protein [Nitrospirota bacterium]|nr:right-handed parallel beta-helix repeat-containing protein [Nitrospirota bacterium]